jgi:DNA-binding CsgD family transcriptional regulator/tetratricopeptide (TPR) repeat protein
MFMNSLMSDTSKAAWRNISKTSPPRLPDHLVRRDLLLMKLHESIDRQSSYLLAPAGYGKTTLLSQWYNELVEQGITCAWLNLEKTDVEISQFFSGLVIALDGVGVDTGSLKLEAEQGFANAPVASIGSEILTLFADLTQKTVIVLDNYHTAASQEIEGFLHAIQRCNDGMVHIAFASRDRIGGSSPALIASGNAIIIEARELKFSDQEVCLALGEEIDPETLKSFQDKVEGWPFAVQMTRMLTPSGDLKSAISTLHGHQGHIAEYLVNQVIENLPENLRDFVTKTALLNEFNMELANEVCGLQNSHDLVSDLNMLDSFIVPMDKEHHWFRYHHLLSECLRNLGNENRAADFETPYRRAIRWCEDQGMIAEAVQYSNLIEDSELSGEIIKRNGGWAIALSFGSHYLKSLMSAIPEVEIQKDARLMLASAYLCIKFGELRKAQSYCKSVDVMIGDNAATPDVELDRLCINSAIIGRSELSGDGVDSSLEDRLKQAEVYGSFCQGYIQVILANEKLMHGKFEESKRYAENAYLLLQSGPDPVGANYAHLPIAMGAFHIGDFDESRRQFGLAIELSENINGKHTDIELLTGVGNHAMDYWQGEFQDEDPAVLYQELDMVFQSDGGFDSFVVGTDALFHHAISARNPDVAQRLIDKLFIANMRYGIGRVEKYCDILQLELCVHKGQLAKAEIYYSKIQKWHSAKDGQSEESWWFLDIMGGYARAQFLASIGYTEEAITQIDAAIETGEEFKVAPTTLRGHALKAAILYSIGDRSRATACLKIALSLAAPLRMRQVFTDAYVPGGLIGMAREEIFESDRSPLLKEFVEQIFMASQDGVLNDRERDVLLGISNGMTNKEIASMLDLTESTIKFHQRKLYKKFGVTKRVNAVSKARELNMLS